MESAEGSEIQQKETRGRPGKTVRLSVELAMSDAQSANTLAGKRMRQAGEYVSFDRILSEAIQCYVKHFSTESGN